MSKMIKLRVKSGGGMSVGSPRASIVIEKGGELDPAGFEIDEELYKKYLKPTGLVEIVAKPKSEKKTILSTGE